jgi:hypothetical protein
MDCVKRKGRVIRPSRSLKVLKKNEKGPLTEYQRFFFSGRNLPQRAMLYRLKNPDQLCH